ncbi:hypothetical protein AAF712_011930 [Marasmius tenuissimus]|uniref:Uncharacterized protein n=1 Tax=Marasmius tenuissimus TaxID=585030 RepID=A0ABR2ZLF3_9AGAR
MSSRLKAYRYRQHIPPLHTSCPTCGKSVSVRPCFGKVNPSHRGYFYEACDDPDPRVTHFIAWRDDLERTGLPSELKVYRFPDPKENKSLQELLAYDPTEEHFLPYPSTPSKHSSSYQPVKQAEPRNRLAVEDMFHLDHPATPTTSGRICGIPIPDQSLTNQQAEDYSHWLDAYEDHLFSGDSCSGIPAPAPPSSLPALVAAQITNAPPQPILDPIPPPNTQPTVPSNIDSLHHSESELSSTQIQEVDSGSDQLWTIGAVEKRLINGQIRSCCSGKGCAGSEKPGRPAEACSFKHCINCCKAYQRHFAVPCRYLGHRILPPTTDPTTPTSKSSRNTERIPKPVVGRPLKPIHYQHRQDAIDDYHQSAQTVTTQKHYEEEESKTLDITFFDGHGGTQEFSVVSKTFPHFKLADAPEFVRSAIGANPEVYHPETGRWKQADIAVPWKIVAGETLLYRAPQKYGQMREFPVSDEMQSMMEVQSKLRSSSINKPQNPLKRKDLPFTSSLPQSPRQRPRVDTHPPSPITESSTVELIVLEDSPSPSPAPLASCPVKRELTSGPAKLAVSAVSNSTATLTEMQCCEPDSRHALWPLRYFAPMKEGIDTAGQQSGGSELDKYSRAFGVEILWPTFSRHMKFWAAASDDLKEEFIQNPISTWKDFRTRVSKEWPEGKVPGLRELKSKKKTPRPSVEIKAEPVVAAVKVESVAEVNMELVESVTKTRAAVTPRGTGQTTLTPSRTTVQTTQKGNCQLIILSSGSESD